MGQAFSRVFELLRRSASDARKKPKVAGTANPLRQYLEALV
jgi:hypothetical protein